MLPAHSTIQHDVNWLEADTSRSGSLRGGVVSGACKVAPVRDSAATPIEKLSRQCSWMRTTQRGRLASFDHKYPPAHSKGVKLGFGSLQYAGCTAENETQQGITTAMSFAKASDMLGRCRERPGNTGTEMFVKTYVINASDTRESIRLLQLELSLFELPLDSRVFQRFNTRIWCRIP